MSCWLALNLLTSICKSHRKVFSLLLQSDNYFMTKSECGRSSELLRVRDKECETEAKSTRDEKTKCNRDEKTKREREKEKEREKEGVHVRARET